MKKTILAAAALSLATGAAFAQSSLQLYGVVDLSIESLKVEGAKGLTRISSSNLATSRLGFKGSEDLGGGLKANFVLESAVGADVGSAGSVSSLKDETATTNTNNRFFDRSAWVGLSGGFGAVRIGRMDSLMGAMSGNTSILGNQQFDDLKIAKMVGSDAWRRIDNAIAYALPELAPGLKIEAQYSLASGKDRQAEAAGNKTDKQYGLAASYTAGPLGLGVSLLRNNTDSDALAGVATVKEGGTLGYASYDFGSFKLLGYYQADQQTAKEKRTLTGLRVNVPVTADLLVTASYAQVKNASATYANVADDNASILAIKGIYSLSKRTAVYGLFTDVSNKAGAALAISGSTGAAAGKDSRGIAVGVRHSF